MPPTTAQKVNNLEKMFSKLVFICFNFFAKGDLISDFWAFSDHSDQEYPTTGMIIVFSISLSMPGGQGETGIAVFLSAEETKYGF